ncbi:thiamine biosynthesis protein ThiF [Thioclava sp. F1Mire-8]|uniref:HesA/MoeB/ThiF family protein n=1 Tax=Thioclava sp. F1Mire-8 TaxID=1973006 RepID=UPI000B541884|nr:HesA/MoeB/ThiF family protein [Thioclava sp. F1Mire-8]OWY00020.1 thiamine biosynthesis protein ThiF [Thioclava sp. F1Mire-8]
MSRYARQMILPEIGAAGQAKLTAAHVAVIGAGGLGCPVLQYLAGAGVGRLTIFDPDMVEESNLHRQPLYRMADLGRPKVEAARDALRALNPQIAVEARATALGPQRAEKIAAEADLVIDAADSFAVSYILSDACLRAQTPLISASVLGQTGYVGGFCGEAPSLRAVFPDLLASGASCATAGVLGPVVGVIGSLQAQIALRVLLGTDPPALGRMLTADLAELSFGGFSFLGTPEPERPLRFVSADMLCEGDLVVDLRGEDEAPSPISAGAVRLPGSELTALEPASGQRVVLCCASGLRAWRAARVLQERGFEALALLAAKADG